MINFLAPYYLVWKSIHIIFMVSWFAVFFYLPRLFVYHAMASEKQDEEAIRYFCLMERKLIGLGHIALIGLIFFSSLLLLSGGWFSFGKSGWLHFKLFLVACMIAYHIQCARYVKRYSRERVEHNHVYFRWFNEIPAAFLIIITLLVGLKPF